MTLAFESRLLGLSGAIQVWECSSPREESGGEESLENGPARLEAVQAKIRAKVQERQRRRERNNKDVQSCLSSDTESVSQLESDVLRLEVLAQETSEQLSAREEQLRQLAAQAEEVAATADMVAAKETERDTLKAKKNLYYMVTRIVWEKVKRDGSKVKGFVLNPSKNEVTTFTVDRDEQGDVNSTNFLWDFIAAGVPKV